VTNQQAIAFHLDHVSKVYGSVETGFHALRDVSLDIYDGEFFTLLGPSGCGKTTLLRMIAGFDYPTSGDIFLHGENIGTLPPFKRPVNTVFQNYALFPHMSVADNIAFGCKMLRWSKADIAERVKKMLDLVQLRSLADRQISMISGGQQQRVALARALAPNPKVLLLDEPLSALDYKLRKDMQVELKQLQRQTGITFIFVTHDQEEALTMSDRIAVMNAGEVLQLGNPKDIYQTPANHFVASFIGETNFVEVEIISSDKEIARVRLEHFPKSVKRFLDKKCDKNKELEQISDSIESRSALAHDMVIEASIAADFTRSGKVTMAVRPEHIRLERGGDGIKAILETIVYLGTDTHFHTRLEDGQKIIVRQQNHDVEGASWQQGDCVTLRIPPRVARILKD